MNKQTFLQLSISALILAVAGCGIEPETLESIRVAIDTVSKQSTQTPSSAEIAAEIDSIDQPFQPSYPQRVDPFSFPTETPAAIQSDTGPAAVARVRILGFADVDQPRVLLKTQEKTRSLSVGEQADGVEVISIHPPEVELRAGTLVWTATMFDDTRLVEN